MRKKKKPLRHKIVLPLPDLDHAKSSVLNTLSSPNSRRNYRFAMEQFITWFRTATRSEPGRGPEISAASRGSGSGGRYDQTETHRGQASRLPSR